MSDDPEQDLPAKLSPRQKDCLRLVYRRMTSKEIAAELGLSPGTVHTYCSEAVSALGARNRRHAAEILHSWEHGTAEEAPSKVQLDPAGVNRSPTNLPVGGHGIRPSHWRQLLPIRPAGAADNDLPVLIRFAWIPVLAILIAIGFGMLSVALGVITDLYRGGR